MNNFNRGLWTVEMLRRLLEINRLAVDEYYEITNDIEFVKGLVVENVITEAQFKEITGQDYIV